MGHHAIRAVILIVVLGAVVAGGCGDNLHGDPLDGLVRVSGGSPFAPSCVGNQRGTNFPGMEVEPSLAVNPLRAEHLVAVWQQDRWANGGANGILAAVSFDGGATWMMSTPRFSRCTGGNADNGGDYDRATDPWVVFAADGTVFLSALVFDTSSARHAMVASRSNDGGVTWTDPTVLRADDDPDVFNDKETITADPTDPGRVYAVWDRLTGQTRPDEPVGTGPIWFARTTFGVWEPARPIFDPGINTQTIGSVIVVLPDGTLVNVFNLVDRSTRLQAVAAIRSTDKGQTWSAPTVIAPLHSVGVQDPNNGVFIRSGGSLPAAAVDRTSGALYVVWSNLRPGPQIDGIALVSSLDGGASWSEPTFVNGAPDAAAFTPGIAVAPDGAIGVTYYDLRDDLPPDPDTFRVTPWLAISHDGGRTWSDEALGDSFDLRRALMVDSYFLGDYQGLAVSDGTFVPLVTATGRSQRDKTRVLVRPVR